MTLTFIGRRKKGETVKLTHEPISPATIIKVIGEHEAPGFFAVVAHSHYAAAKDDPPVTSLAIQKINRIGPIAELEGLETLDTQDGHRSRRAKIIGRWVSYVNPSK